MKKSLKILCIILLSFLIELFVFNFRSFQSINYNHCNLNNINIGNGIVKKNKTYTIVSNEENYIEIKNINKKANNLKLDIDNINNKYLIYDIEVSDDGYSEYYRLPERYYYPNIEKSKYIKLDLSGKIKNLKIYFKNNADKNIVFNLNEISINNRVPIDISWTRLILLTLLIALLYCIRPKSELYKIKINFKSKKQVLTIIIVMLLFACYFWYLTGRNVKLRTYGAQHYQYQRLAESFSKKSLSLDSEPSKELKKLKNPYDYSIRKSKKILYEWDTAYYNGKYYVYFGVVPEILTYLPYHLITGDNLQNHVAIYIALIFIIISIFFLEKEVVTRFFKNTSFAIFIIVYIFFMMSTGLVGIACYPTLYNVPIVYALMFTFWGLYFWLSSTIDENKLSKVRIFIGSLCMALVAGCRPQLLLCSFFAFLIFKDAIKKKKLLSTKSKLTTLCAFIPYIVVAVALMYYNKSRFGSPFDFGANYNLTGNDMTKRGFNLDRIGLGLFSYLLQPATLQAKFPFLTGMSVVTNYMGITISERMFGGALITNPMFLFGLLSYREKDKIKNKNLVKFSILSIIFAIIIIVADTEMAGILERYFSDFSFLFAFASSTVIFAFFNVNIDKNVKKYIINILILFLLISCFHQFLYMFDDQLFHDMINNNTEFYFKWYYLLQWWL